MGGDPSRAAEKVVEAVMEEKRVGGVLQKPLANFFKGDCAVITRMAGSAGAAVAAEGLMVEEPLPFIYLTSGTWAADTSMGSHDEGTSASMDAARAQVRAMAGTRAMRASMHGDSPRLSKT